jgi:hypothetical protein
MNILRFNNPVPHWIHAYSQAPWRIQRQWIGVLLLAALGLAMVASLYLDVASQAAIAGRQIQDLSTQTLEAQQTNADLQSHLAELTSTSAMELRAKTLGFQPVDQNELDYVLVPGYVAPKPSILAGIGPLRPSAPSIPPEYTESLIAWLSQRLNSASNGQNGVLP